jgi:hypothetical protein
MKNTITNLFYGLDNSTREKKKNEQITTPALSQGSKFNNYQSKKNNYFKKEGFHVSSDDNKNVLAQQSKQMLSDTKFVKKDTTLQNKYNSILAEYQKKLAEVSSGTTDFLDRLNPQKNPYLNKNVQFTTGHVCYVTNQGVVKWIPSGEIWDSLRNSPGKTYITLSIPWLQEYYTEGTIIQTVPQMVSGTNMALGETCGNEGSNVYVDKMITNTTTNYNGCYANNSMTFIGGSPPVDDSSALAIRNNNFKHPQIANNTYKYFSWSLSNVPGWNFNCFLLNNSKGWGYPMPYPNGKQCASIQKTQELWTANYLSFNTGVTYTITFDSCGRNCCDGSGLANPINVGLEYNTIYSFTPPVNKWTSFSKTFTVDTQQSMRLSFIGTWTAGDRSTAIQNVVVTKGSSNNNLGGTYTYDMCKQAAIDGGYKFFGLQNVNTETSMGYCGVSNDPVGVVQKGTALAVSGGVALWDSKTNDSGINASLTNQGSLTVYNSSGTSVFNTDNSGAQPSDYLGCYVDSSKRAMPYLQGNMDYASCKKKATDNGAAPYFGLQNSTSGTNAECWLSSNIDNIRSYGKATNCTKIADGTYSGGGWSNAIYSLDPVSIYFLILQDDGNMVIYRGSGPNDNQGTIWSSQTNGQQQKANPSYTAEKSKYGYNWIGSGTALSAGDFIGSTDGSIYLIMQADGNLVLYTSTDTENCQKMKDGNTGGGEGANALYEITEVGIPSNLGKIGYVDSNSLLSTYPDSNIEQTTNGPPKLKNLPVGVSDKMVNIDTLAFEHYPKTDKIKDAYGLSGANSVQKQQLGQLQTQLDLISQQLISETGSLNETQIKLSNQSTANTKGLAGYLKDYKVTNAQLKNNTGSNMNHIVSDSDINVLKENYKYLLWSILAAGAVLVSMNVVKK